MPRPSDLRNGGFGGAVKGVFSRAHSSTQHGTAKQGQLSHCKFCPARTDIFITKIDNYGTVREIRGPSVISQRGTHARLPTVASNLPRWGCGRRPAQQRSIQHVPRSTDLCNGRFGGAVAGVGCRAHLSTQLENIRPHRGMCCTECEGCRSK